jgi:hypothetical protein
MKTLTAKGAKCGCGRPIDLARAELAAMAKHRRPAVVSMALEQDERLTVPELSKALGFAEECNYW